MTKLKNENTDTINRAIHSAMGKCWHLPVSHLEKYGGMRTFTGECEKCGRDFDTEFQWEIRSEDVNPDYTIPGQPLEDAKAWAKTKFKADIFGKAVLGFVCISRDDVPFSCDYDWVADFVTLPALDMANIIAGLINEGEK